MSDPLSLFQNAFYIGNNFNAILYGVELVLYFMTIRIMLSRKRKHVPTDKYFLLFSTVLLLLNTVFVATEAVFGQEMWIVNANYPGGMDAYLGDFASVWYQTFGTAASIVLNLCSDGLLIYRCYVVWNDLRIIAGPVIIYLASFSLGIAQLYESGRPHANYFAGLAQKLGIGYTSCIISLEIILTALICSRIYFVGRRYGHAMGEEVGRAYTSAAAIIVESMLLSTLTGIAYLISFARNSDIDIFFLSIYVMMTCIAPQLVVLRVVAGRAWTREKSTMIQSKLEFTDASRTQFGGSSAANEKSDGLTASGSVSSSEHIPIGDV
ncbi:hypothetical protein BD309DRAFT_1066392 [Dichomitus squalens]|uniref:Uncharacterized protein n=2 Tax=Dichomitus squalens TaxID=114155 RepID=A0A4Q9NY78_9APHY|nr:uncharacterized protein DICSQDRAFT_85596 [Dichomitus squalens LYAD-421 SS1]EJF62039.1 hypothetical protein DICSQDRAFT_85596 [Dichomitus squalens LYAD-421 SS1]TBU46065.1 hypothetical protein BD309DRAFT_1066392 [Dichomitus squalens]TBU60305.1 hypothetical protein BD310DRAFT_1005419 [Dichomitus squalens]